MKKLSVVIPVYNAKKYLNQCVRSVLKQSFRDYEIILVDDGSTDGSGAICDKFAAEHPFIRVVRQENGGASAARNAGLAEAKGEYVHFIDSDDMLACDDVYTKLSEHALDGTHQIIFFRRERIEEGREGIDAVQPAYRVDGEFRSDVLRHVLENRYEMTLTCPVNKIFLRRFLTENDLYFRTGLEHEEDEWLPRVIACADCVWFDTGVYYTVRNHPDSMSKIVNPEKDTARACSKIIIAATGMAYMEEKQLPKDTLALTASYYWDYLIDACVMCSRLPAPQNQRKVTEELKRNKRFFDSSRYLTSRNRRILGVMFRLLGIRPTVAIIGKRYG